MNQFQVTFYFRNGETRSQMMTAREESQIFEHVGRMAFFAFKDRPESDRSECFPALALEKITVFNKGEAAQAPKIVLN